MNQYVELIENARELGLNVLLLGSMDHVPASIKERVVTLTRTNLYTVFDEAFYNGHGGLVAHDPEGLLDSAFVDKFVCLDTGSFASLDSEGRVSP